MDLATLEEANRLRVEMGMKPLPVPGQEPVKNSDDDEDDDPNATFDGRIAQSYDNYKKVQDAELAKRRREEKAEAVKRARDKAQRQALMEGSTLGEADDKDGREDGDARAWLKGQKKRQKKIEKDREEARLKAEAEAEATKAALAEDNDLAGVKVGHDVSDLLGGDGADQVLTLKDSTVLENEDEGDELENIGLREHEALQERLDLKKKRPAYDPMSGDSEQLGGGSGRGILGQYDEEIYGKKRKAFTLDPNAILGLAADGQEGGDGQANILGTAAGTTRQKMMDSVGIDDILPGGPSSDYIDASEIKIKKPKKKSKTKKSTRKRQIEDADDVLFPVEAEENGALEEDASNAMDVDAGDGAAEAQARRKRKAREDDDGGLQDEDDMQAALALQRRVALKKRKRLRPEDLARQLRAESQEAKQQGGIAATDSQDERDGDDAVMATEGGGLVIDETAEFVSNLKRRQDREDEAPRPKKKPAEPQPQQDEGVTAMADGGGDDSDSDVAMQDEDQSGANAAADLPAGLEEEKKISAGMGATLSILRGRGILEAPTASDKRDRESAGDHLSGADLNERLRRHREFVTEKNVRLARIEEEARRRREQDRAANTRGGNSGGNGNMSTREREELARKQNEKRELQTSRMLQDLFNEKYTPNFQLQYTDEHGRELNQKEAFRALSHGFHGKSSGRGKTDKMLKKIEAEKRHMAEGILDASQNVGMSSATAQQLKKRKEAGVRLD